MPHSREGFRSMRSAAQPEGRNPNSRFQILPVITGDSQLLLTDLGPCYIKGSFKPIMAEQAPHTFAWTDLLWLSFLGGLAVCSPILEVHKQETLLAIGLFQIFEHRLLAWSPPAGSIIASSSKSCWPLCSWTIPVASTAAITLSIFCQW